MQVNRTQMAHSPKFTSVIPVRVYIDGMETFSEKNIRTAGKQLTALLAGPTKNNEQAIKTSKKLAQKDPDYDYSKAVNGMKVADKSKKSKPSDFFRLVKDLDENKFYLFTGLHGERVAKLGKSVGNERYTSKINNCTESFDLHVAKRNYENFIKSNIYNLKLRLTELYDHVTRKRIGNPVELNIIMTSNKKYGNSAFKMALEDITFQSST